MIHYLKGACVVGSLMAAALSALFKENEELVSQARVVGGVAACRIHRREEAVNLATGERVYRWQIEFKTQEDAEMFASAIRSLVEAVTEGE